MSSEEWNTYHLGELAEKITKGTTPTTIGYSFVESGINFIKAESVLADGSIDSSKFAFIDAETHTKLKRSQIEENDILFSMAGMVLGKTAVVRKELVPANTNQALAIIRLRKDLAMPQFVSYFMRQRHFFNYVNQSTGQSAQPNINLEEIGNLEITLPPIPIQERIADILSALDDKIELNRQTNATLDATAQAIFKEWFVDFKFPGATGDVLESTLGIIPRGWRVGKLGEILDVKGGTTPSTQEAKYWDGEFHWVTPKDLSNLTSPILLNTERKITKEGVSQISSGILPIGTLLLSSRAPIGYLAITDIPVSINQGFIAINAVETSNLFILHWLKENMEIVISRANGSTFLEISKTSFKEIILIIPDSRTIKAFDNVVQPIFEQIKVNDQESATISQLRDSLLPKLMNGEIEV